MFFSRAARPLRPSVSFHPSHRFTATLFSLSHAQTIMGGVGASFKFLGLAAAVGVTLSAIVGPLPVILDEKRQRDAAKAELQRQIVAETARLSAEGA